MCGPFMAPDLKKNPRYTVWPTKSHSKMYHNYVGPQPKMDLAYIIALISLYSYIFFVQWQNG